jgi:hypothetical protein
MSNSNKAKTIPPNIYRNTLNEFYDISGILSPIYANNVLINPFNTKAGSDYNSSVVNNVLAMIDGESSTVNRVIGYFAAVKDNTVDNSNKFIIAMSLCVPEDYKLFRTQYGRFLAMRKCLSNNCMLIHVDKPQRVITSTSAHWPIYCFNKDNTISHQFMAFEARCNNYYK